MPVAFANYGNAAYCSSLIDVDSTVCLSEGL